MAPLVLIFSAQFVIPDKLIEQKAPIDFLNRYKYRISQNTILVSDNNLTPAVCWSYKRSDVLLLNNAGELAYGLGYDDSSKHRLLDIDQLRELITKDLGKEHTILITGTKRYIEYKQQIPKPVFENIDNGFVFAEFAAAVGAGSTLLPAQNAQQHAAVERSTELKTKDTISNDTRGSP